jgi:sugar phosphate isomerase/epimerase
MQLFVSTTFHGTINTNIEKVLQLLDGLDIDGAEFGSTHVYRPDMDSIINKSWDRKIVTHNFFPPAQDPSFVLNIASNVAEIRNKSISYAKYCIEFAANIGAEVYTIHPGFMAMPKVQKKTKENYDFDFDSQRIQKKTAFSNMLESIAILIDTAQHYKVKLVIETEGSLTMPGVLLMETMEEYDELFTIFPEGIFLNMNLAHTRFAAKAHGYNMNDFINRYRDRIILVEISHNDGISDQHLPLTKDSYIFDYLDLLPNVPYILEFRNAEVSQVQKSIALMRAHS